MKKSTLFRKLSICLFIGFFLTPFNFFGQSVIHPYGQFCVGQTNVFAYTGQGSVTSWYVGGNGTITYNSGSTIQVQWNSTVTNTYVTAYYNTGWSSGSTSYNNITISSSVTPSVSITVNNNNICAGTPVTFTATPVNGGGSPSYSWYVGGSYINGASGNTYTTTSLTNGQQVYCVLYSSASCATTSSATSNTITMTVNTPQTMTATVSGNTSVCQGSGASFSASVTNAIGNLTYQWKKNGSNTSSDVVGPPPYALVKNTVSNGDVFNCVVTSNACANPATSNSLTVSIVFPQTFTISPSPNKTAFYRGESATFTASSALPTYNYQWYMNGSSVSGATNSTFVTTASSTSQLQSIAVSASTSASCVNNTTASGSAENILFTLSCPLANAGPDLAICLGSLIGTPAVPGYDYSWSPGTGLNDPNIAQPFANPAQVTTYTLTMTPQNNLVSNGNFESGSTGFNTDYGIFPNGDNLCSLSGSWGSVNVLTNPTLNGGQWCSITDHSPIGNQMLFVDGSCGANRRVWYETIPVASGSTYYFSGYVTAITPAQTGPPVGYLPKLRLKINGSTIVQDFTVTFSNCGQWLELSGSWTANSNSALIEIIDDAQSSASNDFCLDDLYFGDCPRTSDQVTVTVDPNRPIVSPAGPIDYYHFWEDDAQVGITLTSSYNNNNQWYKNGVLISGATSQTYLVKSAGLYTVRSNGCASGNVVFNEYTWGLSNPTTFGQPRDYPLGINSPGFYCYNSNNIIRQFDLESNANYYWIVYDAYGAPQLSINPTTYNIHSPQADVIIGSSTNGASYTYVLGYAEKMGYVKAMEFNNHFYSLYPLLPPIYYCTGNSVSITNYTYSNPFYINPGASGFEYESYDFGPNSTILTPLNSSIFNDPSDPTNPHKMRIHGQGTFYAGGPINVSFSSSPATVTKHFYSSNGDCYNETRSYIGYNCNTQKRPIPESIVNVGGPKVVPNPANARVTISLDNNIKSIEIFNMNGVALKRLSFNESKTVIVNTQDLKPGLYAFKVLTGYYSKYLKVLIQR